MEMDLALDHQVAVTSSALITAVWTLHFFFAFLTLPVTMKLLILQCVVLLFPYLSLVEWEYSEIQFGA